MYYQYHNNQVHKEQVEQEELKMVYVIDFVQKKIIINYLKHFHLKY